MDRATFLPLIPALVALLLYLNTLWAEFAYDDSRAILKNQDLLPETPWTELLTDDFWGTPLTHSGSHKSYRPLCVMSFRLNYMMGAHNPFWYHLTNVLLHAIVTGLFTNLLLDMVRDPSAALFSGLLFAAHPIHTEAVAGVVGRADVGACLFFILALKYYIRFCRDRDKPDSSQTMTSQMTSLALVGLFAGASLLWKEQGITVLAVCVVLDVFVVCKLTPFHLHHIFTKVRYRRSLFGITWLVGCGLTMLLLRVYLMGLTPPEFSPSDNPASDHASLLVRTLTYFHLPIVNFWLLLCPRTLSFDWSMDSIPLLSSITDPRNLLTVAFYGTNLYLAVIIVKNLTANTTTTTVPSHSNGHANGYATSLATVCKEKTIVCKEREKTMAAKRLTRRRFSTSSTESSDDEFQLETGNTVSCLITAISLMLFPFLPASNLFFYVGFVIAERVLYIPSMGFCLLVGQGLVSLTSKYNVHKRYLYVGFVVLLGLMGVKTVSRNMDWLSEERLYTAGIAVNPPKAWGNLANIYNGQGKLREAEHAYKMALQYRANMADVHYNLGILLQEQKRYQEAIQSYSLAIQCRPRLTMAHLNLGIVYGELGKNKEAEEAYRRCSKIDITGLKDPRLHESTKISALFNLGRLLADIDRPQEAIEVYKEALRRRPSHYAPQSLYNMLGESYSKLERDTEAEYWYKEALKVKPDHVPAHLTMGKLLQRKGQFTSADQWFQKALSIDPKEANSYIHYAQFLTDTGRLKEAAQKYLFAADLAPNDFELIFNAANALRQAGKNLESEQFYKRAVRIRPHEASAHMNLGAMLHFNGKLSEAEKSYRSALKLKPNDSLTQENLLKLQRLMRTQMEGKR